MLHRETVEPGTISLIQELQSKSYINDFRLVGGTALSLQIGHRNSTDIDLFSITPFNIDTLQTQITQDFSVRVRNIMGNALMIDINEIKTDLIFQPSIWIEEPRKIENIQMASLLEIAAMKIAAITSRGRKRDFVDIYCLLEYYSLADILNAFLKKYKDATMILAIRSLFYFEDANSDFDPKCFFNYNWETIKKALTAEASKL